MIGLGSVYFYHIGKNEQKSNITIVKREINNSNQSQDEAQIELTIENLSKDIQTLQNEKDLLYLDEILVDLKDF